MKSLVRIDSGSGRFLDLDKKKLRRQAVELKDYIIENVNPENDDFGIIGNVLPLCEKAIDGDFTITMNMEDLPLQYQVGEGVLQREFGQLYAEFCVTLSGTALEEFEVVDVGGKPHAYIEFE